MLSRCSGFSLRAAYTSLKRCRQLALSSSRLTYITRPRAQSHCSHFLPSAMAMASSICRKLFPALLGPEISILCPLRSTPSIRHGARSGMLSQTPARPSMSGRLSLTESVQSFHSAHDVFPMFVSMINCFLSPRVTPGRRDNLDGLRFCVSMVMPFFRHMSYR